MKILPNLNAIRFILASLVLIQHVSWLSNSMGLPFYSHYKAPIFHKGAEAVYIFFALSGFLIIRLIYLEKQHGHFSIRKFYSRRILRVFPLYYLIVIFGFFFNQVILPQFNFEVDHNYALTNAVLLTTFFLPNIYTELYSVGAIHQVLWSIGIEEQFYIMIAPFSFLLKKNWLLFGLILFTIIYFLIFHFSGLKFLQSFKMVYFYIFFGGIISILEEKKLLDFLKRYRVVPILIVIMMFLYITTNIFIFKNRFLTNLFSMTLIGLFLHTLSYNHLGIIIRNKALNYFGKISYGIYMYHILIVYFVLFVFLKVDFLNELNPSLVRIIINVLVLVLSIIVSHFSYKYFEIRFLKLKSKFRD